MADNRIAMYVADGVIPSAASADDPGAVLHMSWNILITSTRQERRAVLCCSWPEEDV